MTSINERFKLIRENQNLSMKALGDKIGMTSANVSSIELGKSNPSEQTIRVMCATFNVDYFWLTKGEGNMYIDDTDALVDRLAKSNGWTDTTIEIMKKFLKLSPDLQNSIADIIHRLNEEKDG